MPVEKGAKLGPYEVIEPLGAGGMGEVYLARDTRLDRSVAIKVLPSHLADNAELRQRFEREARAVSSLNHPHICTLHDIGEQSGVHYLVMEHLEGETLAQRLDKGPLPVDEALRFAIQIADALDKAHGKGVVHRDLKPGNIMITGTGAKLLDFGLARSAAETEGSLSSVALTQTSPLTTEGTIVGTFQYMSPEQLQGKTADARSDIFSFGAVLYEMITGKKIFEADNQASLIVAVMSTEPPALSSVVHVAPPALDRVLGRCLAKKPEDRWQSARDLSSELTWIAEGGGDTLPAPAAGARGRRGGRVERLSWLAAVVVLLLVIAGLGVQLFQERGLRQPVRASLLPPPDLNFDAGSPLAVSPDGRRLAFVTQPAGQSPGDTDADTESGLWVREIGDLQARPLPGTAGAAYPFWSPDSRWLGFFANSKLNKIDTRGGPVIPLCDARDGRSGSWNKDGVIVFQPRFSDPLYRVAAGGGTPEPVTRLDQSRFDIAHRWPWFLPDGNHFLFYVVSTSNPLSSEFSGIYVGSLDSSEATMLVAAESRAVYSREHLFYRNGTTLMARPFDAKSQVVKGDAVPVIGDVSGGGISWGGAHFGISETGVLAVLSGADVTNTEMTWFDRAGDRLESIATGGNFWEPRLSHDGKRLAMGIGRETTDIWLHDLERGVRTRFTFHTAQDTSPLWSPDDERIVFESSRETLGEMYLRDASGGSDAGLLYSSGKSMNVTDWSADGRLVFFSSLTAESSWDVWVYSFEDGEASPVLNEPFDELGARLSPDGKWLAYVSDDSGESEVFVQAFPEAKGRWMVSTSGGWDPQWRRDGKELFYTNDDQLMSVSTNTEGTFSFGTAQPLFRILLSTGLGAGYDVTADGQKFLVNHRAGQGDTNRTATLLLNWTGDSRQ